MSKLVTLGLALLLCLTTYACGRHVVRPLKHPSKKLIVLPEEPKGRGLRPYVINGERYYPIPDSDGFVQFGNASWYGKQFHGRPTASGEVFNMYRKSAAHKTLPFGTYVKIIDLSNKKQLIVRINDRGPFVKGRIIDLSYAAAKELDLIGPGVARVKIIALGRKVGEIETKIGSKPVVEIKDMNTGDFTVQVGAFKSKDNALRLSDRLKVIFGYVDVSIYDGTHQGTVYRVRVSKSKTLNKAGEIKKKLENMGFGEAFIVSL